MWITENAWPPVILCILGAVVLLVAWSTTQRPRLLIGIPVLLIAAAIIYFVEQTIITDREQVEADLHSLLDTFIEESQQTRADSARHSRDYRTLEFFSPQNVTDRTRVAAALSLVTVDRNIRITDIQTRLTNDNTRAVTHFRANGTVSVGGVGSGGHFSSRWELTWQKEGGRWAVTRTRMLNVMTGEEQSIPRVD